MAPAEQPPLWTVTSQQETVEANGAGNFVNGTRVTFRTRSGAQGAIFVPAADYTPTAVRAAIHDRAEAMETVHNMTGEG